MVVFLLMILVQSLNCTELFDIKGNQVQIKSLGDKYFVVFHSGLSCKDCYISLGKVIDDLEEKKPTYLVTNYSDNVYMRKTIEEMTSNLMNYKQLLFIKKNKTCLTFQESLEKDMSPSMIYVSGDRIISFKFNELFKEGYSESSIKELIINKLKIK